jgi:predicted unusual protein kinase regulating ubiquinone biosynthesis (AarF/ABC1/UbiB family)
VRNLRTFWTVRGVIEKLCTVLLIDLWQCALVAADYKLNFTPGKSDYISALHERVGDRLLNLFTSNGGLYIKFGGSYMLAVGRDVPRHT